MILVKVYVYVRINHLRLMQYFNENHQYLMKE